MILSFNHKMKYSNELSFLGGMVFLALLIALSNCEKPKQIKVEVDHREDNSQSYYDIFGERLYRLSEASYNSGLLIGYGMAMEDMTKARETGSYVPFDLETLHKRGANSSLAPNPKDYK